MGLFGTVVGIIRAFQDMAEHGAGGFEVVAAGISEALIATAAGLAVAIVALMIFNTCRPARVRSRKHLRPVLRALRAGASVCRIRVGLGRCQLGGFASGQPRTGRLTTRISTTAIVAEINITPLTDVFLVLLIIFMVTTSVVANQSKNVDLPGAEVSETTAPNGESPSR